MLLSYFLSSYLIEKKNDTNISQVLLKCKVMRKNIPFLTITGFAILPLGWLSSLKNTGTKTCNAGNFNVYIQYQPDH
jgi:hypothetical protein